jgi:multicomponent Na+:H+ antiporter subunit B
MSPRARLALFATAALALAALLASALLQLPDFGHAGGGFQGGVMLAGVLLLVFFAGRLLVLDRPRPIALIELAEAAGALAFALVAVGGLVFAAVALENFLPSGSLGELLSGGTIPLLQLAVGLEVAGAIALVLTELLDQAMLRDRGDE